MLRLFRWMRFEVFGQSRIGASFLAPTTLVSTRGRLFNGIKQQSRPDTVGTRRVTRYHFSPGPAYAISCLG